MSALATAPPPTTVARLMTVDEFWEFTHRPENEHRNFELHRGKVIEMPSPTKRHGYVCCRAGYLLTRYSEDKQFGYAVTNDSGVILDEEPATVVGPDVAFFREAKRFDELEEKWSEEVPLLVVEVMSPSDRMRDTLAKVAEYLTAGVAKVWLVNFEERFVAVFRTDGVPVTLGESDTITCEDLLPGFACRVGEFFRLPGEPHPQPPAAP